MILFGVIELGKLVMKLCGICKNPETAKDKRLKKPLGGFSETDPQRKLKMRESIYSLAFVANLKNSALENPDIEIPAESRPTSSTRFEINMTALLCAFCQAFTSYLLLKEFFKREETAELDVLKSSPEPTLADPTIVLVKFICAVLFHFKFET